MPIEVRDVTYIYSPGTPFEAQALTQVSLTIRDGSFFGIVGRTGSGKSTLIQLMNGLLLPNSGSVIVDGQDTSARGVDKKALKAKVGLVFQYPEYQLFEETVWDDVAFGPRCLGIDEAGVKERVEEGCQSVGLSMEVFGRRSPFELSGGEMRRAAIAGVLAMRPSYLVMDEPTAGLDPRGRVAMLQVLARLHNAGITVCLISHSMEEVAMVADCVAVMNSGRLVAQGEPRSIFRQPEVLVGTGLEPPEAVRILHRLKAAGMNVDVGQRFDSEEVARTIYSALTERSG